VPTQRRCNASLRCRPLANSAGNNLNQGSRWARFNWDAESPTQRLRFRPCCLRAGPRLAFPRRRTQKRQGSSSGSQLPLDLEYVILASQDASQSSLVALDPVHSGRHNSFRTLVRCSPKGFREAMQLSKIVEQRFPSLDASWRKYLPGGIYFPAESAPHLRRLSVDGEASLIPELEKLSSMGSPWASAILAHHALLLAPNGARDIDRAIRLCKEPASGGDAYAQYVLGWAVLLAGRHREAGEYFKAAGRQLFPPAVLDSTGFFWLANQQARPEQVLISLKQASSVGHFATSLWRSRIYRSGRLGLARRVLGYLTAPFAMIYYLNACRQRPFSAKIYCFDASARHRRRF
jgi:hypothetical protein